MPFIPSNALLDPALSLVVQLYVLPAVTSQPL